MLRTQARRGAASRAKLREERERQKEAEGEGAEQSSCLRTDWGNAEELQLSLSLSGRGNVNKEAARQGLISHRLHAAKERQLRE